MTQKKAREVEIESPDVDTVAPAPKRTGKVNIDKLNFRKNPTCNADNILCVISKGDVVTIENSKEGSEWSKVRLESGEKGFVMTKYIDLD